VRPNRVRRAVSLLSRLTADNIVACMHSLAAVHVHDSPALDGDNWDSVVTSHSSCVALWGTDWFGSLKGAVGGMVGG
jgi:hypothetical protein